MSEPAEGNVTAGSPATRVKVRIRFTKLGKIRWTSHRDVARMWERAFRRTALPLSYSEGFSPRPRVSFGLALPTGHESVAEFLDVDLSSLDGVDLAKLGDQLSEALPVGIDATAVTVIEPGTPSLQEDVSTCSWRWLAATADGHPPIRSEEEMAERVKAVLDAAELVITRTRKGTEVIEDVRPGIVELKLAAPDPVDGDGITDGFWLEADLAAQPRSVRPAEVLTALGPGLEERHVRRTHQWILRHGARQEPLSALRSAGSDSGPASADADRAEAPGQATEAPPAIERAS